MKPRLLLFRSLWTNGFDLPAALADCAAGDYDGVEGPVPLPFGERADFAARLQGSGRPFIAEIATGGGYVPVERAPGRQLEEFKARAEAARTCGPLFLTVLAGCDHWPIDCAVAFFGAAQRWAEEQGLVASFETHRSRPTFNPWATAELLRQLPGLRLTCDFSHWCCVCERLVLEEEPAILGLCAARAHHVHARVGYAQGPQAPDPSAPEFREALQAHERWWEAIWRAGAGRETLTLTPEFGPDGYLQGRPFTGEPAADLDVVNRWMGARQRERFARQDFACPRVAAVGEP